MHTFTLGISVRHEDRYDEMNRLIQAIMEGDVETLRYEEEEAQQNEGKGETSYLQSFQADDVGR